MHDVTLVMVLEFAILLGYDGQLQQSDMEMELFTSIIDQLKNANMTKIENALVWIYVNSWGKYGQHMLDEQTLWNFGGEDLEAALTVVAYQTKNDKSERTKELQDLIMERFDDNIINFFEWSRDLHKEVIIIKCINTY